MTDLELTPLQLSHAKTIVATTRAYVQGHLARSADYAARAADIALETALVESGLRIYANPAVAGSMSLPHDAVGHDHLSVGVFQQQVPMWGSVAECQPVIPSTQKFLHRLFTLHWAGHSNGALAQAVQGSAYPGRYMLRDAQAIRIRKALW